MSNLTSAQLSTLQGYATSGDRISYWMNLAAFQAAQGQDNRYALLALGVAADNNLRCCGTFQTSLIFATEPVKFYQTVAGAANDNNFEIKAVA